MSGSVPAAGKFWVGAGFALALAFLLAVLWWSSRPRVPATADAVWFLPPAESFSCTESARATKESSTVPADDPSSRSDAARASALNAARMELAEAEAELADFLQAMEAAREAIADAVVMVQEQRENFDYAKERFDTLMPLVETGALEPLAASQIQSAYISARASLAQAKYLLGQARRDFGTMESRRRRHELLQSRIEHAKGELRRIEAESAALAESKPCEEGIAPCANNDAAIPPLAPHGHIEAVFVLPQQQRALLAVGMEAAVYSSEENETQIPVSARVSEILEERPTGVADRAAVRVRLVPAASPSWPLLGRTVLPCRIVISPGLHQCP